MKSFRFFTAFSIALVFCFSIGCENPASRDSGSSSKPANDAGDLQAPVASQSNLDQGSQGNSPNSDVDKSDAASEQSTGPTGGDQDPANQIDEPADDVDSGDMEQAAKPRPPTIDIPETWKRLSPENEIWLDNKNKQVIVGGQICLTAGPLEMLICPRNTKEHESVISARVESWQVHGALMATGATPGEACKWDPDYSPAWGPKIEIEVLWKDAESGEIKRIDGRQWILNIETRKPMVLDLVFGGSFTETNEDTGQNYYTGNDGALICLANFSTATVDLRIEDAQTQAFFEANTPKIPPLGTQVYAIIKAGPVVGKPKDSDKNSAKDSAKDLDR